MQANIRNMEDAQRIAELETEVSEYKLKVSCLINIDFYRGELLAVFQRLKSRSHLMLSNDAVENGVCLARNSLFTLVLETPKLY